MLTVHAILLIVGEYSQSIGFLLSTVCLSALHVDVRSPTSPSNGHTHLQLFMTGRELRRERRSPALCFWLGDTHHCPKVYAQKCPKDRKILRIYRQRQGLCTKTHRHTRPVGHKG